MRTVHSSIRLLRGSASGGASGGRESARGGGSWRRGFLGERVCSCGGLLRGVSQHALRQNPPVNRMTDRSKNITFATSFANGNNGDHHKTYYTCPYFVKHFSKELKTFNSCTYSTSQVQSPLLLKHLVQIEPHWVNHFLGDWQINTESFL